MCVNLQEGLIIFIILSREIEGIKYKNESLNFELVLAEMIGAGDTPRLNLAKDEAHASRHTHAHTRRDREISVDSCN